MSTRKINIITPTRAIKRMHGGSGSTLVEASDGLLYVIKWVQNPQGPNLVMNEIVGSLIYIKLGIPTPHFTIIYVAQEFIDKNQLFFEDMSNSNIKPKAGYHFASLWLGNKSQDVFDAVPTCWINRIENRSMFLASLVADVWCDHVDSRQVVFVKLSNSQKLSVFFIDHGHLFNGPRGDQEMRLRVCFHLDMRMYHDLDTKRGLWHWISYINKHGDYVINSVRMSIKKKYGHVIPSVEQSLEKLSLNKNEILQKIIPDVFRWL